MSDFYTPLEVAVEELQRRRALPELQEKVRREVKLPTEIKILFERPHLVMFRQVLTPLTETLLFFELAKKYNLTPFVIEYYDDKFVSSGNQFKRGLGKLPIYQFTSPGGRDVFEYKTVVDFNEHVGHPIKSVNTVQGESLINLHHELFFSAAGIKPVVISADGSNWFKQFENSKEYYKHFLKLFLRDNILFETFISNDSEAEFADSIVIPGLKLIQNNYMITPLIAEIIVDHQHQDVYWDCYPKQVADILKEKGYS
ncbi:MAG: hypothetical protein RLZZ70_793 [Candidatus Parcubacteria bacterium]